MRKIVYSFILIVILFASAAVFISPASAQPELILLEEWPGDVYDLAISADGKYLASTNKTHLFYYSIESLALQWTFYPTQNFSFYTEILDVAMSSDGEYVVAGYGNIVHDSKVGGFSYFNESSSRTGLQDTPTWTHWYDKSAGAVERGCMDISDDGEYITVAGTGDQIYYFTDCRSRTGETSYAYDWTSQPVWHPGELVCLDMTPDGRYIAVGGYNSTDYYVAYYDNDTVSVTGKIAVYVSGVLPLWEVQRNATGRTMDIAISDDGFGVVAGYKYNITSTTYYGAIYWNDSYSLSNNPEPTWYHEEEIISQDANVSVALSNSGNKVAGGSVKHSPNGGNDGTLYFWTDFGMINETPAILEPNWTEPYEVFDVAMSGDGGIIAAITDEADIYNLRVFNSTDSVELGSIGLDHPGEVVAMSDDGKIIAVGTSGTYTTVIVKLMPSGESTDVTGVGKDTYSENEVVYATGSDYPGDIDVDVYVVSDLHWEDGMAIPPDVSNDGNNTVHTSLNGNLGPANVWQPPLTPGEYDLVFDTNRDGYYNATIDVVDDPNDPGFTVEALRVSEPAPVGGEIVPVSGLAALAPWIVLTLIAITIGYTISRRKILLH